MINLISDLPYNANVCKANFGRVVKIRYTRSFRPGEEHVVIASIKKVEERFHLLNFGHPYDVDKKMTIAGGMGLDYNEDTIDITFITQEEFQTWLYSYIDFHNKVMNEKGYDSCIEDLTILRY